VSGEVAFCGWRKSSHSSGNDNCLELATSTSPVIGVRDSKNSSGPVLVFNLRQWSAFIAGLRAGDFVGSAGQSPGSADAAPRRALPDSI
jgi:hypothetical protein